MRVGTFSDFWSSQGNPFLQFLSSKDLTKGFVIIGQYWSRKQPLQVGTLSWQTIKPSMLTPLKFSLVARLICRKDLLCFDNMRERLFTKINCFFLLTEAGHILTLFLVLGEKLRFGVLECMI